MRTKSLGRTGVRVSEYCLGTMMFGGKADKTESNRILDHALDKGVNFIDTADIYTANESERILGDALSQDGRRNKVILATKFNFPQSDDVNDRGLSRRHIINACDASLQRLKTDWIDLYQMHRGNAEIPIDETLRALDDLIRAGKVRYIGTSMFPGWRLVEALWAAKELGLNRFVCEQSAYHVLDRTAEREVIPAAQSFGIGMIIWGPLCGGLLSGKYDRDQGPSEARWQAGKDNFGRAATDAAWDVIDLLRIMAAEKNCAVSQLALAWVAAQPGVTAPIIGPRTLEQVADNLGAADVSFTQEDFDRIDQLSPPRGATMRYYDKANAADFRPSTHRTFL